MGGGSWRRDSFASYSRSAGRTLNSDGSVAGSYSAQEMFKSRKIDPVLNPFNVMRECCDSEEHPETVPVILALDVTGSMGSAATEVAKKLNIVMTELYNNTKDVEFLIMGIGDLAYDRAPIQASQFESDIRIAEQLDKIYFEGGGGGNRFESYTAAWYFALNHTKLDCHKRGKKGLIITMGDEPLNPYLPFKPLNSVTGDKNQGDVETVQLYSEVIEKFELYHIAVVDSRSSGRWHIDEINKTFGQYLDGEHLRQSDVDSISGMIIDIVRKFAEGKSAEMSGISWGEGKTEQEKTGEEETEKKEKKGLFGGLISW